MQRLLVAVAVAVSTVGGPRAASDESDRFAAAARVVQELQTTIPDAYWGRARCVAVIPDLKKAAFVVGGEYGKGVMSCRAGNNWSAPIFMQLAKGSWGFQAGAEQVDVVLLVMNESGVQKLLQNKVTLGADASVAAGPIGRQGQVGTDAALSAEILSYSRAQGLFAGIDLSGGVFRPDEDANRRVYGARATPKTILASREISAPTDARAFLAALHAATPAASQVPRQAVQQEPGMTGGARTPAPRGTSDEDLRARIVAIQQILDHMLADTTPAPVGTSGATPSVMTPSTVVVDRVRLLQMREHLEALLSAVNRRQ